MINNLQFFGDTRRRQIIAHITNWVSSRKKEKTVINYNLEIKLTALQS